MLLAVSFFFLFFHFSDDCHKQQFTPSRSQACCNNKYCKQVDKTIQATGMLSRDSKNQNTQKLIFQMLIMYTAKQIKEDYQLQV